MQTSIRQRYRGVLVIEKSKTLQVNSPRHTVQSRQTVDEKNGNCISVATGCFSAKELQMHCTALHCTAK